MSGKQVTCKLLRRYLNDLPLEQLAQIRTYANNTSLATDTLSILEAKIWYAINRELKLTKQESKQKRESNLILEHVQKSSLASIVETQKQDFGLLLPQPYARKKAVKPIYKKHGTSLGIYGPAPIFHDAEHPPPVGLNPHCFDDLRCKPKQTIPNCWNAKPHPTSKKPNYPPKLAKSFPSLLLQTAHLKPPASNFLQRHFPRLINKLRTHADRSSKACTRALVNVSGADNLAVDPIKIGLLSIFQNCWPVGDPMIRRNSGLCGRQWLARPALLLTWRGLSGWVTKLESRSAMALLFTLWEFVLFLWLKVKGFVQRGRILNLNEKCGTMILLWKALGVKHICT